MHRHIAVLAMFVLLLSPMSLRADPPQQVPPTEDTYRCPAGLQSLSPMELWNWRFEKHQALDLDAMMCTYAPDAVVMMSGQIMRGRAEIRAGLEMMLSFFPAAPTITSVTEAKGVLHVFFHAEGALLSIPDGCDTFVVKHGLIHVQTVHASLVPTVQ
ncbi:MAG TPA: hypothetical protein DFS52_12440 [Myxococcales bacterium]|nr:hypothetical protein [Myxococcales bacterium]